ncbi:MAG: hypothetical protein GC136_08400 [Alphaproteobacteria bacterium]|nr:hypothetical protein [Alphaproteobacteria bacterium]
MAGVGDTNSKTFQLWQTFQRAAGEGDKNLAAASLTNAAIALYNENHVHIPTKAADVPALLSSLGSVAKFFEYWSDNNGLFQDGGAQIFGAAAARLYQIDGNTRNYDLSLDLGGVASVQPTDFNLV